MTTVAETLKFVTNVSDILQVPVFAKAAKLGSVRLGEYLVAESDTRGTLKKESDLETATATVREATIRLLLVHIGGFEFISWPAYAAAFNEHFVTIVCEHLEHARLLTILGLYRIQHTMGLEPHVQQGYQTGLKFVTDNPTHFMRFLAECYPKGSSLSWQYPEDLKEDGYYVYAPLPEGNEIVISIKRLPVSEGVPPG